MKNVTLYDQKTIWLGLAVLNVLFSPLSLEPHGIKTLNVFNTTNGMHPMGAPVIDSMGNLYGVTRAGGKYGYGTIYSVDTQENLRVLHHFSQLPTGMHAYISLTSSNCLYATTESNIVKIYLNTGKVSVINAPLVIESGFRGPDDSLLLVQANERVSILKLLPNDTLVHFAAYPDQYAGNTPNSLIVVDKNVYGINRWGGEAGQGSFFYINPDGNYTLLTSFQGFNGVWPEQIATQNTNQIYGICLQGGGNAGGTIFTFNPSGDSLTTLYKFTQSWPEPKGEINSPIALSLDENNMLYGLTAGASILFSFDIKNQTLRPVHCFGPTLAPGYLSPVFNHTIFATAEGVGSTQPGLIYAIALP